MFKALLVEKDEEGYISAIELKENGRHEVELVIDCTGFRGLIINQALDEPFVSYSNYLANDRAMAVQLPHPDPKKLEPMTRSTALGAGWSWRVPLFNRIGTGYVYSSAHRTDEEAMEEFRRLSGFGDALNALNKNPLPTVLVVHPTATIQGPDQVGELLRQLESRPEVDLAQLDMQWVKRLFALMEIGKRGVYVLASLLALAVLLVVGNTIRLAIQNRRDEIVITKLFGATPPPLPGS